MHTRTVGQVLKEERQKHRLSLTDLSQQTRIRLEYLKALESDRFQDLPAATFVKGYIKAYARIFGFDHQPLLALLRRDYKESAKGRLVPRDFIKPVLKKGRYWRSVTVVVAALAGLFLGLFLYVGFQWYRFNQPPLLTVSSPQDQELVSAQVLVSGQTLPDAILSVNNQPVALQPDGSFQTEVFLPTEGWSAVVVEVTDRRGRTNRVQRTVRVQF